MVKNSLLVGIIFLLITATISLYLFNNSKNKFNKNLSTNTEKLIIKDIDVGTGPKVKIGDKIVVMYIGTLENGNRFADSYRNNQVAVSKIGVGEVIKGWDQGIIGMKVGGVRKLVVPPSLAYSIEGLNDIIPPNSTLTFEIKLLEIK
ncbi:MAG: FKBP-type peptidyl-prolyl cis-trans isomerase [Candidatus Shapirobacteria bacterium]